MHRAERLRRAGTGWRCRSALWPALAVDNPAAHPAGGQPPCGRCRGLPTAAAAGTDALRVGKPASCPRSGCPTFEKLPWGEGEGLGVQRGQRCALTTLATGRTRARNPSHWETEAAGARCANARQGAQPWGSGGASPLPGSAIGAAGTAWGALDAPLRGAIYARRAERLCPAKCSESTFAKMGPPGAH